LGGMGQWRANGGTHSRSENTASPPVLNNHQIRWKVPRAQPRRRGAAVDRGPQTLLARAAYRESVGTYQKAIEILDLILSNMMTAVAKRIKKHLRRQLGGPHGTRAECGAAMFRRVVAPYLLACGATEVGRPKENARTRTFKVNDMAALRQLFSNKQGQYMLESNQEEEEEEEEVEEEPGELMEIGVVKGDIVSVVASDKEPLIIKHFKTTCLLSFSFIVSVKKEATGYVLGSVPEAITQEAAAE
jgi:hypothetical protein